MTIVKANMHKHDTKTRESASSVTYYTFVAYFVDGFGSLYGLSLIHI